MAFLSCWVTLRSVKSASNRPQSETGGGGVCGGVCEKAGLAGSTPSMASAAKEHARIAWRSVGRVLGFTSPPRRRHHLHKHRRPGREDGRRAVRRVGTEVGAGEQH